MKKLVIVLAVLVLLTVPSAAIAGGPDGGYMHDDPKWHSAYV